MTRETRELLEVKQEFGENVKGCGPDQDKSHSVFVTQCLRKTQLQ